jgi:tetratricopeptide (TPR) repeat protein
MIFMRYRWFVISLALFFFLTGLSAVAQRVTIRGKVTDNGKPVQGAEVLLSSKETGQKYTMKSDKKGEFTNIGIAFGLYDLTVNVNGQKRFERQVMMNQEQEVNIDLTQEAQAAQQRAEKQLTPEQRKQIQEQREAAEKEQSKVKNLNQMLAAAKAAEDAGNYDQAVATLTQAAQVDPNQPIIWARLGKSYMDAGAKTTGDAAKNDYAQAANSYEKAIALKPNDGGYHNNLGQAYLKLSRTDDAIKEYNTVAQLDPANAAMYFYNLGAVLTNSGKVEEANQAFDKALAIKPDYADAYYWKGVNMLAKATLKGDKMEAPPGTAENFNKYLELQPSGPHAEAAKQMLASIGAKIETGFSRKKK